MSSQNTVDIGCGREPDLELIPEIPDEMLPSANTQEQAYGQVIELARAIPDGEVKPLGVETRLAYVNARDGFALIAPHLDMVGRLPDADIAAIERVPQLAAALLYADRLLSIVVPAKKDGHAKRMMRTRQLRTAFLHQAKAAATLGYLPEAPVERIAAGRGDIDAVEDVVALVALFRRHDVELAGRILATPELLDEGERLAAELQGELRPKAAPVKGKATDADLAQANSDRNRLWTLLHQSYSELQRVALYLGERVGKVPSLQSRRPLKPKPKAVVEA